MKLACKFAWNLATTMTPKAGVENVPLFNHWAYRMANHLIRLILRFREDFGSIKYTASRPCFSIVQTQVYSHSKIVRKDEI
jgi:hypothetical protein